MKIGIVLCALAAVAHADASVGGRGGGAGSAALLRVELRATEADASQLAVAAFVLVAPGHKPLWRRPPPPMLANLSVDKQAGERYRRDPRARLESFGYPFVGSFDLRDAIVVSAFGELVFFARSDGRVLLERTIGEVGFGEINFARAEVTVECDGRRVVERVASQRFLIDCGTRLLYYWGAGMSVFKTAPYSYSEGMMFPDVTGNGPYEYDVGGAKIAIKVTARIAE
jgi:hypothetical protein